MALLQHDPPDLIVLDLGLPDGDGAELVRDRAPAEQRCRSWWLRRARTRPARSPCSMPAPTTTWSSRSASASCWRASGSRCATAARRCSRRCTQLRAATAWRVDLRAPAGRARRRAGAPHAHRVQAAGPPGAQRRPGRHAPPAAGRRVGRRDAPTHALPAALHGRSCAPSSSARPAEPRLLLHRDRRRLPASRSTERRRRAAAYAFLMRCGATIGLLRHLPSLFMNETTRRQSLARPHPRRHRRRLRRHRHQPAVHDEGDLRPGHRRAARRAAHRRRGVGDLLGADAGRHAEVRAADPARRQPRRGRHHGADGAGRAARPAARRAPHARCCCSACSAPRCSTATASSRRRSRCSARWKAWRSWRRRSSPMCCRSRVGDPGRPVRGAALRHRARSASCSGR